MGQKNREADNASQQAIDEFIAKGGEIQYCEPGARTEDITYIFGKKKKKKEDEKKK